MFYVSSLARLKTAVALSLEHSRIWAISYCRRTKSTDFLTACTLFTFPHVLFFGWQGVIKPALVRLRDATTTRAQELLEEALALQERRDSGNDMLTERTEENALLGVQVCLSNLKTLVSHSVT